MKYKYNNITFILDVSTSMNSSGKLNLLKLSMIELVKMLRAEDKVTLIKYSSTAEAIMTHESGAHHEEIIKTGQSFGSVREPTKNVLVVVSHAPVKVDSSSIQLDLASIFVANPFSAVTTDLMLVL